VPGRWVNIDGELKCAERIRPRAQGIARAALFLDGGPSVPIDREAGTSPRCSESAWRDGDFEPIEQEPAK